MDFKRIIFKKLCWLGFLFGIILGHGCEPIERSGEKLLETYELGSFSTGFKSIFLRDSSRTISGGAFRPIQIGFWYPAHQGNERKRMTFKDYFLLSAGEKGPADFDQDSLVNGYKKLAVQFGVSSGGIDSLFQLSFSARRNSAIQNDAFPLVLIAQGNFQTIFHQAVLGEYLASHGFYVATTPHPIRITGPYEDYQGLVAKAFEQAEDLDFAKEKVFEIVSKQNVPVGIIGYSFGARSALLYAMNHPDLKALVSLDGGIGNKMGKEWIDYVDNFDSNKPSVPLLHFYQEGDEVVQPDFSLIKSLNSTPKEFVKVDSVRHSFFTVMGAADGAIPSFMANPFPNARLKYQKLLDRTGMFLKNHLGTK